MSLKNVFKKLNKERSTYLDYTDFSVGNHIIEASLNRATIYLYPVNTNQYINAIEFSYELVDLSSLFIDNHEIEVRIDDETNTHDLIPKINELFNITLTENDIVNNPLGDMIENTLYEVPIVSIENNYYCVNDGILIVGPKPKMENSSKSDLNYLIVNNSLDDHSKLKSDDGYFIYLQNCANIVSNEIEYAFSINGGIIAVGSFELEYYDYVTANIYSINANNLVLDSNGNVFHYTNNKLTDRGIIISNPMCNNFIINNNGIFELFDSNLNMVNSSLVTINNDISKIKINDDGSFYVATYNADINGMMGPKSLLNRYNADGTMDDSFNEIEITTTSITNLNSNKILDIVTTNNYINLLIEPLDTLSVIDDVPVINGFKLIENSEIIADIDYGWIPVLRFYNNGIYYPFYNKTMPYLEHQVLWDTTVNKEVMAFITDYKVNLLTWNTIHNKQKYHIHQFTNYLQHINSNAILCYRNNTLVELYIKDIFNAVMVGNVIIIYGKGYVLNGGIYSDLVGLVIEYDVMSSKYRLLELDISDDIYKTIITY